MRDVFVGGGGKALSVLGKYAPRLTDKYMESTMIESQKSDRPGRSRQRGRTLRIARFESDGTRRLRRSRLGKQPLHESEPASGTGKRGGRDRCGVQPDSRIRCTRNGTRARTSLKCGMRNAECRSPNLRDSAFLAFRIPHSIVRLPFFPKYSLILTVIPITETDNPNTSEIDKVSTLDAVRLINNEDKLVAHAIEKVLPDIANAIDRDRRTPRKRRATFLHRHGHERTARRARRLRDPADVWRFVRSCPGRDRGRLRRSLQSDRIERRQQRAGCRRSQRPGLTAKDAVVGIAASGRTPYTIGAVKFARELGCFTACIVCNPDSKITETAEIAIVPVVGPEAITGSTRMKAGTAQKMILNMISTVAMIRLGYVHGNRMTNMKASNEKLQDRAVRILMDETKVRESDAVKLMKDAGGDLAGRVGDAKGQLRCRR